MLKLHLQQSGDYVIQNMFFNGWTHDNYVGNVFVFAPNGRITSCAVNAPGPFHASTISDWGRGYENLEIAFNEIGGHCVVYSAFCKDWHECLIKSAQGHLSAGENIAHI